MTQNDLTQVEQASKKQQTEVVALRSDVDKIEIADQTSYEGAVTLLKMVKARKVFVEAERKDLKAPALELGKKIDALFKPPLEACTMAENALKMKINEFLKEENRKRQEAQRIADEKAERERARLEKHKQNAEERGDLKKAAEFEERKELAVAEPVKPTIEKVDGIRQTETWRAELVDMPALIEAAVGNETARDCLSFNQAEANRQARFFKADMKIPGLRAVSDTGIAASRQG